MGEEKLTCTKVLRKDAGRDAQNKPVIYHEKCGAPASEVEISGILTSAKAVLCSRHALMAESESFVSKNGFSLGKVSKKAREKGYKQEKFPVIER